MELFLVFFDMLGEYLLVVVEESRVFGKACGSLNATLFVMISKKYKPDMT